jgi:hypothetical protein
MTSLRVQNFIFQFPDSRPVVKYDDCNFYRDRLKHLHGTKAVDVLAINNGVLFIVEATDLTGFRIDNKKHVKEGGLALETAQKVRDTIAVLYGAYRNEIDDLRSFCDFLYGRANRPDITVVLVLEEDRPPTPHKSFEKIRPALLLSIKQKLKFLGVRCAVHNCTDVPGAYGWTVQRSVGGENRT